MKDTELVVKYQNELNLVPLKSFNSKEMDLFFSLCARMKDKGMDNVHFSFEELKHLSDYHFTGNDRFVNDLRSLYKKMLSLSYETDEIDKSGDRIIKNFVLFTGFEINVSKQYVDVSVNPKLENIINGLTSEFSKFELSAFTSIRSTYAKTLFRLLIQYKNTGYYVVKIENFRELMNIPEYYKMGNIDQTVLKPALRELDNYFTDLSLTKVKAKKGNKIAKLEFRFSGLKTDTPKVPLYNWLDND